MGVSFSKSSPCVSELSHFATQTTDDDPSKWREYDYIIVGGGTAGCVLASRLSEDRDVTVLLIEAGGSKGNLYTKAPLAFTKAFKSALDWAYYITSPYVGNGGEIFMARGKMLGGTSALNAMIYDRCSLEDWDSWAQAGCTGWSFKEVEPYFRKVEGYIPSALLTKINVDEKGTKGPWKIRQTPSAAPIADVIINTCKDIGIPYVEDLNSSTREVGVGRLAGTIDEHGNRHSTALAYLTPDVLSRPNLTVAVNTNVEKILFGDGNPTRAAGVQLATSASASKYRVAAKREVILSAGVVSSPHLLFVSGIGAAEDLKAYDVKLVKDLPAVGKHLLDHISSGPIIFRTKPGYTLDDINHSQLKAASSLLRWLWDGTGPFGCMGVSSVAYARSDNAKIFDTTIGPVKDLTSGPNSPDLELMWTPAILPSFFENGRPGEHGVTFASILLKPESEGMVEFKSGSIYDRPLLHGNYFASENDLNIVARGVRLIFKLGQSEPLRSLIQSNRNNTDKSDYFWLTDQDPDQITDDQIRDYVKTNGHTTFHPAGSCRMGTDATDSVVDPSLKVHGIAGLRVVDTSVYPTQVSGHPQAPVVAIAEKAADLIKADRRA